MYVEEINNESIIERSWILHKIHAHNNHERKGILLSADMGFGKSTIVSNIVCAAPRSIWYSLRQQVLVYHMCRYDLFLTTQPEVFFRNLAGAIVREMPEIGNTILSDDMALDFLYGKCTIDPVACLEYSVLNKLKHVNDDRKHLIIIDAIDECETSGGTDLHCKDLNTDDCNYIPESLEKIYMLNFERVFGEKGDLFEEFISVFEVLCTLQNPIEENKLLEVAGLKSQDIKRKTSRSLRNELRHFIKISNGYMSFQHKSISDFLTDSSRKYSNFYVDLQNGHKRFAEYLLNSLNVSMTDNLMDVVHHVAMSRVSEYENILFQYVRELKRQNPAFTASQYGNEKSLLALLDHGSDITFQYLSSDQPSIIFEDDRTMSSKNGHTKVVILLLDYVDENCLPCNMDISWRPTLLSSEELEDGNNLVQIAYNLTFSKGEKLPVVEDFENLRLITCDTPLNAAVKNGHIEIVKILGTYSARTVNLYAEQEVRDILERSFEIPFLLSKCNSPYIIELLLNSKNALRCDGNKSALHEIVHNDRNIQWTFHSLSFLDPIFEKYSVKFLDECFDDRGYNLLHRSIMGAHLPTIHYLINQGMNRWQPSKDNKTALEIFFLNSPYTDNGIIPTYYTFGSRFHNIQYVSSIGSEDVVYDSSRLINFDETATNLLHTNDIKIQLIRSQLCDSKNKDLGLIHIAAAKGYLTFLKTAREMFGLDYLRCEDQFGVTPMYIAHIYNQTKIVNWMRKLKLHIKRPTESSENILLFNMIDNYMSPDKYDWTCLLRYRYRYTGIIRNQVLKCSVKNSHLIRKVAITNIGNQEFIQIVFT
ncbi:uncharacterized protein LOC127702888 [Mytilus californianus]|uniref:uncharacterized protein LOC127702888 n=1 Tax=Mytilus californianus TaxID=6549 RepID=UPI0022454C77|nr:uncharacterized protein LOC127702888 [Mytilus californianus]